jgi:hypothetical protein
LIVNFLVISIAIAQLYIILYFIPYNIAKWLYNLETKNERIHKMPRGIKNIEQSQANKMIFNFVNSDNPQIKNIELSIIFIDGKFYEISEAEPLDISEFIQTIRARKFYDSK